MDLKQPIYVTRPSLPPLDEFTEALAKIWNNRWITNMGPFHELLEKELCEFLGVKHLSLFSNGTLALITALQTLRITGEVITTPFSFVATTHALWWNGIKPVFADIDPKTFNLDPEKVESAITPHTTAIMPVHVYGIPCDTNGLQTVADKYGLKIIYDAAHAFGVRKEGVSVLHAGDLSVLSFHATKVYNTIEGGAIVCHDAETKQRIDFLKNFGFADEVTVVAPGINGKMNEIQAAYGLIQLKYLEKMIGARREISNQYREMLTGTDGICIPEIPSHIQYNYAYFPIIVESSYHETRDELYIRMQKNNIFGRRYFYPLISQFPSYKGLPSSNPSGLPIATRIADGVICLPIYPDLTPEQISSIVKVIRYEQ